MDDGGVAPTFVALDDGTAGFDAAAETVIGITGYTGDLTQLTVVGAPDLGSFSGISTEELMAG